VAYVNSVLQPGETIKVIGKLHWIIFVRAFFLAAIGIVILAYSQSLASRMREIVLLAGWLVILLAALVFLHGWFMRWITELSVTTHRVIYKRGFIRRHTVEMNMDKVETVNVDQSLLGRLLDYGAIRVLGTGQGIEGLEKVASPIALRNAIISR
jgi:uncharacterized membrane protein YdbT with pleckstrin-like domain